MLNLQFRIKKGATAQQIETKFRQAVTEYLGGQTFDPGKISEDITVTFKPGQFRRLVFPEQKVTALRTSTDATNSSLSVIWHESQRILILECEGDEEPAHKFMYAIRDYFVEDAGYQVTDEFEECDERMERLIKNTCNGKIKPLLPIVLVACTEDGIPAVDAGELANRLFGSAHVVFAWDPDSYKRIAASTKELVQPSGNISILFFNENNACEVITMSPHPDMEGKDIKDIETQISKIPHGFTPVSPSSWAEALERKLDQMKRYRIADHDSPEEEITNNETENKQKPVEHLQQEVKEWKEKYQLLEKRCRALEVMNNNLTNTSADDRKAVLFRGNEEDYYLDEVQEVLVRALKTVVPNTRGRAKDILVDIIENNPSEGTGEQVEKEIRAAFRADPDINARCKANLSRLGFDITSDGKHYKLCWHGDKRYLFTMAKTSSHNRTGENEISTVLREIF